MKRLYNYFVYGSLLFLAIYLARRGFLEIPNVRSLGPLLLSLPFLVGGFLGTAFAWQRILNKYGFSIGVAESIASMGISVFGKYIPGKVWSVVGRAAYLAGRKDHSLGALSAASLQETVIALWTGLVFGTVALLQVGRLEQFGWLMALTWVALSIYIFSPVVHGAVERAVRLGLRREIKLPTLDLRSTLAVLPWLVAYWLVWSVGFHLLVRALSTVELTTSPAFAFPLATTLSTIAVFAPGGLGVREGVMAAYLSYAGVPLAEAATISVASRLWFLLGEVAYFLSGLAAAKLGKKRR